MKLRLTFLNRQTKRLKTVRPRLLRIAYAWCHDRELAEDLVQKTCLRVLKSLEYLKDERAFEVWVFRIMANLLRKNKQKFMLR